MLLQATKKEIDLMADTPKPTYYQNVEKIVNILFLLFWQRKMSQAAFGVHLNLA